MEVNPVGYRSMVDRTSEGEVYILRTRVKHDLFR